MSACVFSDIQMLPIFIHMQPTEVPEPYVALLRTSKS